MKFLKKVGIFCLGAGLILGCCVLAGGCSFSNGKRIVRIAHGQSETHPEHLGLLKFEQYVEEHLGDQYDVQIYPNELLGSSQKAIELAQTGAIDFVVSAAANLENFSDIYEIFSMPYLFHSEEIYRNIMSDTQYMEQIYQAADEAGFRVLTWYNAGTRSFYAKKPIYTPEDLRGMKIRVQQSPASVSMCKAFGAAASPMSFGEVYTAIQQGVIDGAENNELAMTNNKHGEVAKYYSYTRHQMVPDLLIGSLKFLDGLTSEEYDVFYEAALLSTETELKYWDEQIEEAKQIASEKMGVTFIETDMELFQKKVSSVQQNMLDQNKSIRTFYDHIQEVNKKSQQEGR
ncbi:MAG: TRAP transporter substrate-binding protein [Eubacteriales bacterium]|nr:TRAP transporter substrate-binding protein [Eubacteriales bacterium]